MRQVSLPTVPAAALISPEFSGFSQSLVARDGVFDVYLNRSAGPVAVSGGEFGPQTIEALAMADDLAAFLKTSLLALDAQIDLRIRFVDQPERADVRFYLDSTIDLGDGGVTLGIALVNDTPTDPHWEVLLNTPELATNPLYLQYAALHELGHTLGLEHPFDDLDGDLYASTNPYRSAYPEQTLMAYRQPQVGDWPVAYTASDRAALIALWGAERSGSPNRLIGTNGVDRITGGLGNDALEGLDGADQLRGGAGSNTYASPADAAQDWIVISPDGSRRLARSARTLDVITELGAEDRIAILGARNRQLGFGYVALESPSYGPLEGIGIYAKGCLEAVYTGGAYNRFELSQLTLGLPTDTLA